VLDLGQNLVLGLVLSLELDAVRRDADSSALARYGHLQNYIKNTGFLNHYAETLLAS
jgi:hypothetical protein